MIIKTKFSIFLSQVSAQTIRMQLKLPFIYFEVQKDSFEFITELFQLISPSAWVRIVILMMTFIPSISLNRNENPLSFSLQTLILPIHAKKSLEIIWFVIRHYRTKDLLWKWSRAELLRKNSSEQTCSLTETLKQSTDASSIQLWHTFKV